jgi:flagellar hook-basal body complex protein FliE
MKLLLIASLSGLLAAIFFLVLHGYFYDRPIGVVQIDAVIAQHVQSMSGQITEDSQRSAASTAFDQALSAAIKKVEETYRVTLLVKPAVLTEVPDYTQQVIELLNE